MWISGGQRLVILVLIIADCLARIWAQCDVANDCSTRCNPDLWKRQLCLFYSELRDWRETAARCGVTDLPDIVWDEKQSAVEQWDQARALWLSLRRTWRHSTAASVDAFFDGSGSGSGVLGNHDNSVDLVTGDRVEVWREEQSDWSNELSTWRTLVEGAEPKGAWFENNPGDLWSTQITNWAGNFSTYNTTFYNICPQ